MSRFDDRVFRSLKSPNLELRKSIKKLIALCVHLEQEMPSSEMRDSLKFKLDEIEGILNKFNLSTGDQETRGNK